MYKNWGHLPSMPIICGLQGIDVIVPVNKKVESIIRCPANVWLSIFTLFYLNLTFILSFIILSYSYLLS